MANGKYWRRSIQRGNDSRIVNAVQNVGSNAATNITSISAGADGSKPGSPVAGQMYVATDVQRIYRYDGSSWVTVAQVGGTGFSGSLAGDVSGPQGTTVVDKIKGVAVDNTGLSAGKYLKYSGGSWVPGIVGANDLISSVTGTTQFVSASCNTHQTLTWSSLTDSFSCQNISLPSGQVTGLGALAAKGSVDLGTADATGTLAAARMPALTGDVTLSAGTTATAIASNAVTTAKINNLAVTDAKINDVAFSKITSKPTTLSGYGITDAAPTAGSTSITTLGTITTGTWNGSVIPVGYGGTGATSAAAARTNLGAAANGANSDITSLSATTSVTSSSALALNAGGSNQSVNLVPTGTGTVGVASRRITSVATPTAAADAATKAYVDAAGAGSSAFPTMISAESATTYTVANANLYCDGLNTANSGAGTVCEKKKGNTACDSTQYTGWRLASAEELGFFLGYTASTNYLWTRSVHYGYTSGFVFYRLSDGGWSYTGFGGTYYVRCVR